MTQRDDEELREELGRLAALAGARVDALSAIGEDIATLSAAVADLAVSIQNMATKDDVAEAERRQDRKRRLVGVGIAIAFVLLAVPGVFALFLLGRLNSIADQNSTNGDILIECTTPSPEAGQARSADDVVHECYERGQQTTAKAVGDLTLGMIDAAICARASEDESAIQECFAHRIEARNR